MVVSHFREPINTSSRSGPLRTVLVRRVWMRRPRMKANGGVEEGVGLIQSAAAKQKDQNIYIAIWLIFWFCMNMVRSVSDYV
jgi:hypothetical protein